MNDYYVLSVLFRSGFQLLQNIQTSDHHMELIVHREVSDPHHQVLSVHLI